LVSQVPNGLEDSSWGGIDLESVLRCHHGKHPRRMYSWEGKDSGQRLLGCPLEDKAQRCGFVHWVENEWPPRAQQVILTLWDMVSQFMEKEDMNMVDVMAERALKNEIKDEKEALEAEKDGWETEKQALLREKE